MKKLFLSLLTFSIAVGYAATWSTPPLNVSGMNAIFPQVAVDGSGNAVAVWETIIGSNYIIQGATLEEGSKKWIPTNDLSLQSPLPPFINIPSIPQVAVDGSGDAVAVWYAFDGSNYIVQASTLKPSSSTWSSPKDLSQPGQNAFAPQVAIDGSGNAVAVWYRFNGSNNIIQGATLAHGSKNWIPTSDLSQSGQNSINPHVAIAPSGNAVAVWETFISSGNIIQGATLANGKSKWIPTSDLSLPALNSVFFVNPQVAVDPSGDAVAVWFSFLGPSQYIIQGAALASGSKTWTPQTDLSQPGNIDILPKVAVDGSGNAVALWSLQGSDNIYTVQAAMLPKGSGRWSKPENLSPAGQNSIGASISADIYDNFVALWQQEGSNMNINLIMARTLPFNRNKWSPPQQISLNGDDSESPQVSIGGKGFAVAVWFDNTLGAIVQSSSIELPIPKIKRFIGEVLLNQFLTQTDYIHVLSWKKIDSLTIATYEIYLGDELIASVPASGQNRICLHNRPEGKLPCYRLVAVNALGVVQASKKVTCN